jgi:hypothetical protein
MRWRTRDVDHNRRWSACRGPDVAKPLVAELSTKIVPHPGASRVVLPCRAAVVTSDPDLRVRTRPRPPQAAGVGVAQAQPRTAGTTGAGVPAQGRAVRRRGCRIRGFHHDMLALCQRNRRAAGPACPEPTTGAAEGETAGRGLRGDRRHAHPDRPDRPRPAPLYTPANTRCTE